MPAQTKFTAERRSRILQIVRAGGSLREAARGAAIDHATLLGWLRKGRTGHPSGRWHEFYREVEAARAGGPELTEIRRRWENPDTAWLMKWIEPEWRPDPPPSTTWANGPLEVEVRLSTGEPFDGSPVGPAA